MSLVVLSCGPVTKGVVNQQHKWLRLGEDVLLRVRSEVVIGPLGSRKLCHLTSQKLHHLTVCTIKFLRQDNKCRDIYES